MKISSSRNILKSRDAGMIQPYVPPVQTNETRQEERKKEKEIFGFSEDFLSEDSVGQEADGQELPEAGEAAELLEEAAREADEIRQEAERIRRNAREEAVLEKQQAADQGYQEGFEWGREEGCKKAYEEHKAQLAKEWELFKEDMAKALASVEEAKQHSLDKYLGQLMDCAIAVGEKVIHTSLQSSGAIIKRMIMAETEKLKKTAWVRIYMGRTDYDMMMQADEDVINELSRLSDHIKFVVMNKEKRGDCIIEMHDEVIDISVDTQMENIRKVLENVM